MDGQTAVVTGVDRGVGEAVARRFAAEGARVVVAGREQDAIDAVVEDIEDAGGDAEGLRADVRDEFDVERLMETAARAGEGGIDAVAACAQAHHGDPGETPLAGEAYASFDDTLRTNARGAFVTVREALPHLDDGARVLVPSGGVARDAEPGWGSYAVSKAAAEAVVRQFAAELDYTVGALDLGRAAESDGESLDHETAADLFLWAATDAPAEDVDGEVVGPGAFERATT